MLKKTIKLGETQRQYTLSDKKIVVLIGPKGEGKTFAAIAAIFYHAEQQPKPIRGAIIRDTFTNIERNTIPSIQKMMENTVTFHKGGKQMKGPNVTLDLFGVDDLAAISNLQGAEYAVVWLEEPAPVYEIGNAGLREEVFDIALTRGPREPGITHKVLVTMNAASEDHWTYHKFFEDPTDDMGVFNIPYGENKYLPIDEREATKKALRDRPDLYARYVEGRFSFVAIGEAVTPEYNERFHRSETKIDPMAKVRTFRFWDGGLYPSCVIGQVTPRGKFVVTDTLRGENMGMKQFLQTQVRPLLDERYREITNWRDLGDPSLLDREQSDSSVSAATIINGELGANFEGGEAGWEARKEALKELLNRMVDGEPMFMISAHEGILHRALRGGWHYHRDNAGNILRESPVKDIHSHPADALSHGIARIFGYKQQPFTKRVSRINVAKGYAVPKLTRSHARI